MNQLYLLQLDYSLKHLLQDIFIFNVMIQQVSQQLCKEDQELSELSFSSFRGDNEQFECQIPDRNECQECKIIQSYRTKHCIEFQKCIPKYDHHCFWIGGCVGKLNHGMYWLFLKLQCLLCFDGLFQFSKQFVYYSTFDEEFGNDQFQYQYFLFCQLQQHILGLEYLLGCYYYIYFIIHSITLCQY
ncbi:unnamed protein product [Paramecium primaurelia]|uniref:Palmitoyltransferase n=1 Tax=Paramecium primaurelia TaxID=5886 RepID=A0A8S1QAN0_PARPR|nr:unnamed protein product [Paramecium primaurelia]